MKLSSLFSSVATIGLIVCAACSDLGSECAKANVSPSASCGNDNLQCPYTLDQPNCDGTSSTVSTSCVCTSGAWVCPSAVECPDDAGATE
jgi:hypothetical protein